MALQNDAFEMKEETSNTKKPDVDGSGDHEMTSEEKVNGLSLDDAEQGVSPTFDEKKVAAPLCSSPYAGMGKEELLQFSQTPGWRAARWTCLLLIVAGWCAMLGVAVWLIVSTPRCLPWWQSAVVYQIYPRSFKDSTNDGIGDFRGIMEKIDYLQALGINAVLLNSVYKSGGMANGEDIVDFSMVDSDLGDIEDFTDLVQALHDADIKVILDFIPNHSSINHEFFNQTKDLFNDVADTDPSYQDYYTLADTENNWVSKYSGSAWDCDVLNNKCFLHQFSSYQADFNLNLEPVVKHLTNALETWFTRGVDGFNIRGVKYFFEDPSFTNDPPNPSYIVSPSSLEQYDSVKHDYTSEYNGKSHELLQSWRDGIFYQFSTAGTYRVMLTDSDSNMTYVQSYYGASADDPEANLPMNFQLLQIGDPQGMGGEVTGREVEGLVKGWMDEMESADGGDDNWPNFQLGNYASRRITSRLSSLYTKVANMLLLTLPGTPLCYYGDEIGMQDLPIGGTNGLVLEDTKDQLALSDPVLWEEKTRDPERSPMQWSSESNAGFSGADSGELYLPVHTNYETVNVHKQEEDDDSVLNLFRRMVTLRSESRALASNQITFVASSNEIVAYVRELESENSRFFVALNFGSVNSEEDYFHTDSTSMPLQGTVVVATNAARENTRVELNMLHLAPGEGVVVLLDEIVPVSSGFWYKFYTPEEE